MRNLQSNQMECLAVEFHVTTVELFLPRLRLVLIKDRHPALGLLELVKITRELRVRLLTCEVLGRLDLYRITLAILPVCVRLILTIRLSRLSRSLWTYPFFTSLSMATVI